MPAEEPPQLVEQPAPQAVEAVQAPEKTLEQKNRALLAEATDPAAFASVLNTIDSYQDPVSGSIHVDARVREAAQAVLGDLEKAADLVRQEGGYSDASRSAIADAYAKMQALPGSMSNMLSKLATVYFDKVERESKTSPAPRAEAVQEPAAPMAEAVQAPEQTPEMRNRVLLEGAQDLTTFASALGGIDSFADSRGGVISVRPELKQEVWDIATELGHAADLIRQNGQYTESSRGIINGAYSRIGNLPVDIQTMFRKLADKYFAEGSTGAR